MDKNRQISTTTPKKCDAPCIYRFSLYVYRIFVYASRPGGVYFAYPGTLKATTNRWTFSSASQSTRITCFYNNICVERATISPCVAPDRLPCVPLPHPPPHFIIQNFNRVVCSLPPPRYSYRLLLQTVRRTRTFTWTRNIYNFFFVQIFASFYSLYSFFFCEPYMYRGRLYKMTKVYIYIHKWELELKTCTYTKRRKIKKEKKNVFYVRERILRANSTICKYRYLCLGWCTYMGSSRRRCQYRIRYIYIQRTTI